MRRSLQRLVVLRGMTSTNTTLSENIVGTMSHFFVTNRPLSLLLIGAVVAFGALAFMLMPKQYNPEIVRPAFALTINYHGATTEQALTRVVYELNEKVMTVVGVDEVYMTVRDGAVIESTVIFEVGHDATKAKVDLLAQLSQHSYLAEGSIESPQVMEINPETIPVLQVVFRAATLSPAMLREQVMTLSQAVAGVPGVSEITVSGGYVPALVIELDVPALTAATLTVDDVRNALIAQQARLVAPGVRTDATQLEMVFDGQARSIEDVSLIMLREGVFLRDVARVYEGTAGSRSYVFNETVEGTEEVVTLAVAKVEGASAPVVTSAFLERLQETLMAERYADLSYTVVGDDGATAAAEISGLLSNLITSIVIVAVVLLLFLSVRAALVVLIAIPTTLVIVFGIGYLFDQTINRITLFALILSLGLLVDSAIVVVENIYSHLREWRRAPEGIAREQAIAGAVHEIGIGLVLSTVTSVIVFLPMKYITGMMGPYMAPIAFFVPVALLVSMFVAIIVVPFTAAHVLNPDEVPSRMSRLSSERMDRLVASYERFLQYVLVSRRRQRTLLLGALCLFLLSLLLPALGLVHFQMLPKADRDQFYVYIDLPEGTDVETTVAVSTAVSAVVAADADVTSLQHFVATAPMLDFNGMFKGAMGRTAPHQATLRVNLVSARDRKRSSTDIVTELRSEIMRREPGIAPAVRLMEDPPGPPVQATLVAKFMGTEAARTVIAHDFARYLTQVSGVVDVDESTDAPVSRVRYTYDRVAGATLGVSPDAVLDTLKLLGEPQIVGEYIASDAPLSVPIMIAVPAAGRDEPYDIAALTVRAQNGVHIPLSSVLTVHTEARPSSVRLEQAVPLTYVTAEVEGRSIVYVTINIMRDLIGGALVGYTVSSWDLFGMTLMSAAGDTLTLKWGGEWEMTLENFRDLGIAMGVALALVYAVLAAQYKRFDTPGYILITVPLGLIGILIGFFVLDTLFGIYLTATALIGFIALIGIVVNNAIIYLEYVEQSVSGGMRFTEALRAAGAARLRPIVLTSLTTILGSLTIAGDPVWSGLAWAIVFGLSLSTVLTLVIYPTMLAYFRKSSL
jgi:multidrug efflux pump subunit AcrB